MFECVLSVAVSHFKFKSKNFLFIFFKQQSNCTPWDYPLPNDVNHAPMCMSYFDGKNYFNTLKGFEMVMEDSDTLDHCTRECLPNCEQVTYSYVMDTTYLNYHGLCQDKADMREVIDFTMTFL